MRRGENPAGSGWHLRRSTSLNTIRLPPGVRISRFYDRIANSSTTRCTRSRGRCSRDSSLSLACCSLFLGSVRAAHGGHHSALAAVRLICMHMSGIPANLLSLGALDFGIIVDGTLVMVEHRPLLTSQG